MELADLLAARGIDVAAEIEGEGGVARLALPGAERRWHELRELPGWWPVLDGGGVSFPDARAIAQTLAIGRALDAGAWLRRRRTTYELPAGSPEPDLDPGFFYRPEDEWPPWLHPRAQLTPAAALLLVPTDVAWAAPAALGVGGGDGPDPEAHLAVLRRWFELYGAELAAAQGAAIEVWVERPPRDRTEAKVLAREHLAYCPGVLDEPAIARATRAGAHPLEAIAATRLQARVWRFEWKD